MSRAAAVASSINAGLAKRGSSARVALATIPEKDKARQIVFFFAQPTPKIKPDNRNNHSWGEDKISCWRVDVIANYCDQKSLIMTNGSLQVCTICGAFRYDLIVKKQKDPSRKQSRRVLFAAKGAAAATKGRPRCKGALK